MYKLVPNPEYASRDVLRENAPNAIREAVVDHLGVYVGWVASHEALDGGAKLFFYGDGSCLWMKCEDDVSSLHWFKSREEFVCWTSTGYYC